VVRITAPVSVKHIHQPVLLEIDTLDGDRADLLEVATNPFGTLDVTNSRAMKALLLSGRLALSAALAANQKFMDTRHYTVTIHAVIPHPRGTIIKFYLQHPATRPTPTAWTRDTTFDIEAAAAETYHCKVLSIDQAGQQLLISARSLSWSNLLFLLNQEVFMKQPPDYNLYDLWIFSVLNQPTITSRHFSEALHSRSQQHSSLQSPRKVRAKGAEQHITPQTLQRQQRELPAKTDRPVHPRNPRNQDPFRHHRSHHRFFRPRRLERIRQPSQNGSRGGSQSSTPPRVRQHRQHIPVEPTRHHRRPKATPAFLHTGPADQNYELWESHRCWQPASPTDYFRTPSSAESSAVRQP
uniref:Uncharacterized protein n=1 Tax=Caenorhabditis japonica TaxID=281687 RepID=A0A8R1IM69_CAEJA